jgi:hypothetical protein
MLSFKVNKTSLAKVVTEIRGLDEKAERKAIRKGLRRWAKYAEAIIKSNITWNETTLKNSIGIKIKRLKKKRGFWVGVGIEGGKLIGIEQGGDFVYAATKARWYEGGWHAYPKGVPSGKKTRGWRRGLRGRKGQLVYKTQFMEKSYELAKQALPSFIEAAIKEAIESQN